MAASTSVARSITPQVLICEPKIASASVLSPSVTATYRMLSPKRATLMWRAALRPAAARHQSPMRDVTVGSEACPTTVVRATPRRVSM